MTLMVFVRDKNNMIINLLELTTEYKIMISIIWNEHKLHFIYKFISRHDIWDTMVAYKGFLGSMDIEREFRHFPCYLCLLDLLKGVKHVHMYDMIDVTYVSS
jgi:hypothetical protein